MIPRNRKEFEYSDSLSNFHPRLVAPCHQNLIATFDEYTRRVKKKTNEAVISSQLNVAYFLRHTLGVALFKEVAAANWLIALYYFPDRSYVWEDAIRI